MSELTTNAYITVYSNQSPTLKSVAGALYCMRWQDLEVLAEMINVTRAPRGRLKADALLAAAQEIISND